MAAVINADGVRLIVTPEQLREVLTLLREVPGIVNLDRATIIVLPPENIHRLVAGPEIKLTGVA